MVGRAAAVEQGQLRSEPCGSSLGLMKGVMGTTCDGDGIRREKGGRKRCHNAIDHTLISRYKETV